jgi:hypothetical protein
MTTDDRFAEWLQERRSAPIPAGFVEQTMHAVQASGARQSRRFKATWLSALAIAAGVILAIAGHAATIGTLLCALQGVAQ